MSMDYETFKRSIHFDYHDVSGPVRPEDDRVMMSASIKFTAMKPVPVGDHLQMSLLEDEPLREEIKDWLARDLWALIKRELGPDKRVGGMNE